MSEAADTERSPMRLQRFLARAGVASRRHAEVLIADGRVSVNGTTVSRLGTTVTPGLDEVVLDGRTVTLPLNHTYLLLNKPSGVVTSMSDPREGPPSLTCCRQERVSSPWGAWTSTPPALS